MITIDMNVFTLIGEIVVISLIIIIFLIIITAILSFYLIKHNKLVFPKIFLFTLNLTYPLIKRILVMMQLDDLMIDRISIDLRNLVDKDEFAKLNAEDVIMVLPHCLRSLDCPAKLGASGLECIKCGGCSIGTIKKYADEKGIDLYIVPGSTFIKNVLKIRKFKGVIGVACPVDLNLAMMSLEKYVTQGVYLLTDGCITTKVDEREVIDLINKTQPTTNYNIE